MQQPNKPEVAIKGLRIACLEPAATQVCLALGLASSIVGVTHECSKEDIVKATIGGGGSSSSNSVGREVCVLTKSGLDEGMSQIDIHNSVSEEGKRRRQAEANFDDDETIKDDFPVSNLYPMVREAWEKARPTVVFTQDLCAVCAPTPLDVQRLVAKSTAMTTTTHTTDDERATGSKAPIIVSLQPKTLEEVADTFLTVANACFPESVIEQQNPGKLLKDAFWFDLQMLQSAIEKARDSTKSKPKLLMLEWLDPPFSGGHWVHAMMEYACVSSALGHPTNTGATTLKSPMLKWKTVEASDPDCVVVGCCGFSLQRNVDDTRLSRNKLIKLRAAFEDSIFACDGNKFFAQPTPLLVHGCAILAACAYKDQPEVLKAIKECHKSFQTPLLPTSSLEGWERVSISSSSSPTSSTKQATSGNSSNSFVPAGLGDIEDVTASGEQQSDGFYAIHQQACLEGKTTYIDPATGYQVFTEEAHKKRGYCCGSGCRHCPYSHVNVKEDLKTSRIQQPSLLYRAPADVMFSCQPGSDLDAAGDNNEKGNSNVSHHPVMVLFFSGGKDSFLTIRALVRQQQQSKFGLVLLTTFDAQTRMIAHQDVSIDDVLRQAQHLKISLLGVPLHRGSGQGYVDRIVQALKVLDNWNVTTLLFGDLHLEHIKDWREEALSPLGYELEYPVWNVPYDKLMTDLESSGVPCVVSATTREEVSVGTSFNRKFYNDLVSKATKGSSADTNCNGEAPTQSIDAFGERGEFHSLAKVWEISREQGLGI